MQVVVIWQLLLLFMMHNIGINFGNSGYNVDSLRIISYNCRGFNDSKQRYMQSLLSRCELLFVQEHWLSDGQLCKLNTLSPVHHSYGICGFSSNEVLRGRPYGGCAILWRQGLCRDVVFVDTGSKRLCAVRCTFDFGVVLFLNVYMPCVGDEASVLEFVNELSIIEGLLSGFNGDHVVVGGDFNVDFNRAWRNTNALRAFCDRTLLQPTVDHCNNMCDYSYSFNMQRFQLLDHFLVSQQLFQDSITDILVLHDTDNLSDHEPVCMYFSIALQCYGVQSRSFVPKVAWQKARPDQVDAYAVALRDALSKLAIPHAAFVCRDVHCRDSSHCICLNKYIEDLTEACLAAAKHTLPHTSLRSGSGRIPGWSEHVEPVRQKSIFWHDMWVNCGRPRSGVVADIMRRTRASYHYAIRMVRRREKEIVNERFAEAVSSSNGRDFWNEVKRIRHSGSGCSNSVDGLTSANEIASFFADKYQDLYTSVPYNASDMSTIGSEIDSSLSASECTVSVSFAEVYDAVHKLKPGKSDGLVGLSSDFFLHACDELSIHISLLFTSLLVHGHVPEVMSISTVIPIPKGKNVNITESVNYRGIALSSIFSKLFDMVILHRYCDLLCSCNLQFGFKRNRSTDMCTMLLKETVSYYVNNDSPVYCTFLDATKAFDRVDYSKLFRLLIRRKVPSLLLRFLLRMYLSNAICVDWNGVRSSVFNIVNGVKQGGVISPVLFCVYVDDLLCMLAKSNVGCYIGTYFLGALAYADDIVLLAPTASAMRSMLRLCDSYAFEYKIVFNASKSKCIRFAPKKCGRSLSLSATPTFYVNNHVIEYVDQWPHLGHVISSDLDDKHDIMKSRNTLVGQINNVLCFFGKLDSVVKMRLLVNYCYSLYGCCLWNFSNPAVDSVCAAWRSGVRRVWGLPNTTHCALLPLITCRLPVKDEIVKRMVAFVQKCLSSDCDLVRFVARYAVWFGRMSSPLGANVFHCVTRYGQDIDSISQVRPATIVQCFWRSVSPVDVSKANLLVELLFLRSGTFIFSAPEFALQDVKSMIECVACH